MSGGVACSTTTATAGSTSTASRGDRSRPASPARRRVRGGRATASSATAATGRFEDATEPPGSPPLPGRGYGHGVAVGDYDNDGHPDLFVTRWRSLRPLPQPGRRDLRGRDRARPAWAATATGRPRRPSPTSTATATSTSTSATTSDWDPDHPRALPDATDGRYSLLRPGQVRARLPDHVFRNDGGRFVDVTERGRHRRPRRPGPGRRRRRPRRRRPHRPLRRQRQDGQLTCSATWAASGSRRSALTAGRRRQRRRRLPGRHGRGLRRPRRRRPARPGRDQLLRRVDDASTTTWARACSPTAAAGHRVLAAPAATCSASGSPSSTPTTTAGSTWRPPTATSTTSGPLSPTPMPAAAPTRVGPTAGWPTSRHGPVRPWRVPRVGRGLAAGDLDNDGRVDCLVVAQDEPLAYFHNRTERGGHFVTLRLEGTASNRDGVGARVTVAAGGRRQVGATRRRRQLPVGRRPAAPFRPGRGDVGSSPSRCAGPRAASIAGRASSPTWATVSARATRLPGPWQGSSIRRAVSGIGGIGVPGSGRAPPRPLADPVRAHHACPTGYSGRKWALAVRNPSAGATHGYEVARPQIRTGVRSDGPRAGCPRAEPAPTGPGRERAGRPRTCRRRIPGAPGGCAGARPRRRGPTSRPSEERGPTLSTVPTPCQSSSLKCGYSRRCSSVGMLRSLHAPLPPALGRRRRGGRMSLTAIRPTTRPRITTGTDCPSTKNSGGP